MTRFLRKAFLFLCGIVSLSCSTSPYRAEVPLSDNTFTSPDGNLRGRIPIGWFAPPESDLPPHLAAWIIREDYAAVLTFEELKIDQSTARTIEREGLGLLAEISFSMKQAEDPSARLVVPPQTVSVGRNRICRYPYRSDLEGEQKLSVAVFRVNNRYYESTIRLTKPSSDYEQAAAAVQEAVILSMEQ